MLYNATDLAVRQLSTGPASAGAAAFTAKASMLSI